MKPKLFRNPFRKKSPTEQLVSTLTESITSMFQYQMNDSMADAMNCMSQNLPQGGRQEAKDDVAEQNRIYATAISIANGNRDDTHRVPEQIVINNFKGDKMAPEQRHDAQDIIDTINEANQINSTGTYRTEGEYVEQHTEPSATGTFISDIFKSVADFFTPIARSVAACFGAILSILVLSKMTKVVESIT